MDHVVDSGAVFSEVSVLDVLALDEALSRLSREAPDRAQLVKLRFFAGLSLADAASALGISRATASRQWAYARAWLFVELSKMGSDDMPPDRRL